VTSNLLMILNY